MPCFSSCRYSQLVEGRLKDLKATLKTNDQRLHSTVKDGVILLKSTFFVSRSLYSENVHVCMLYSAHLQITEKRQSIVFSRLYQYADCVLKIVFEV